MRIWICSTALFFGMLALGCGSGTKEETIAVKAADPLAQPKSLLKSYSEGQALGSETTSFEYMVNEVRKTDPAKADILQAGFAEIEKTRGPALKAKAKEILSKLGS